MAEPGPAVATNPVGAAARLIVVIDARGEVVLAVAVFAVTLT